MNARRTVRGLLAIAAIIAIIGGVPLLLIRLAGSPIPAHLPDWRHLGTTLLRRDDTGSVFITLVRDLTWLAWLIFSVALVTELQAAVRGRIAPRLHLGGFQSAAARLAALAALTFTTPASAGLASAAPASAAAFLVTNQAHEAVPRPPTAGSPLAGGMELVSSAEQFRFVTVKPGDCLWTLAAHYLGDGDLYPQIADLNLGHRMDDGVVFTDPNIIYPGWRLEIPVDAAGSVPAGSGGGQASPGQDEHPGIPGSQHPGHNTTYPRFSTPHPAASASAPAVVQPSPPSRAAAATQSPAASTPRTVPDKGSQNGSGEQRLIAEGAALALLAGGVLASLEALRRRQRSRRQPGRRIALPADDAAQRAERKLRAADAYYRDSPAPPPLSLRAALQELAAGLRAAGRDLPECVGVHLVADPPRLEILLAKPSGDAPAPFTVTPGRQEMAWQLDLTAVWPQVWQSRPVQVGELMPGLFTVGTTTTGYLLLDLELMQVAVVRGQAALTDRFITTAATELATNQWSGWYDLVVAGPFPELGFLDRVEQCDTLEEALQLLWLRKVSIDSRLGSADWPPGAAPVRNQRLQRPDDEDWALTVLVSRVPPTLEQFSDLVRLADRHGIAVLIPSPQGHDADAPASIDLAPSHLHQGGATATIRLGALGAEQEIVVETVTLSAADYAALGGLFAAAVQDDIRPDEPPYQDFVRPPWLPPAAAAAQVAERGGPGAAAGDHAESEEDEDFAPPSWRPPAAAEVAGPDTGSADDSSLAGPDADEFERPPWLPPVAADAAADAAAGHVTAAGRAREAADQASVPAEEQASVPAEEQASVPAEEQASVPAEDEEKEEAAAPAPGSMARGQLRIGILGPAEVAGAEHAVSREQTELVVALALTAPEKLSAPALATLLGSDPDRPIPLAALRQLVTRTRRALGLTASGAYYIGHDGAGYYLSEEARLDWTEFASLVRAGLESGDAAKLATAMELVRGRPLAGSRYWWIDAAMLETINAQVVDAALALAEARLAAGDATAAAAAAHAGLRADPAAEQLSRVLMRAEHAAGNQDGLDAAWDDCHQAVHAVDPVGRPQEETTDLYRALNADGDNQPVRVQG